MWKYRELDIETQVPTAAAMRDLVSKGIVKRTTVVFHARFTKGTWTEAFRVPPLLKLIEKQERAADQAALEEAKQQAAEAMRQAEEVQDEHEDYEDEYELDDFLPAPKLPPRKNMAPSLKTTADTNDEETDSQFLLKHGAGLIRSGKVVGWAVFGVFGILPYLSTVWTLIKTGKSFESLLLATVYATAVAAFAYYLYYMLRLVGAMFRVFAHIERNTR